MSEFDFEVFSLTFDSCEFIHLVNDLFWMSSLSSTIKIKVIYEPHQEQINLASLFSSLLSYTYSTASFGHILLTSQPLIISMGIL